MELTKEELQSIIVSAIVEANRQSNLDNGICELLNPG